MPDPLNDLRDLEAFRLAASAIVKSSFRVPDETSLLLNANWEDSHLCMFVDLNDLSGFFDRLFLQVSQNGGNPARLEYIRHPGYEPKRWLQTPASLLIKFVQVNLESADFMVRVEANDPEAMKVLDDIASRVCGCCFPRRA